MSVPPQTPSAAPAAPTDPEDVKIITLARSALARTAARQGACLRDTDGRTYAAASVDLPHLQLSAVGVAVAMASSSGAYGVEAVAVAGVEGPAASDLAVLGDLAGLDARAGSGGRPGSAVVVWHVDPAGRLQDRTELDGRA